jgi:hypothetical protein
MVAPIVPGSAQVTGFRVYMHNAEVSYRYYYIEFFQVGYIPALYTCTPSTTDDEEGVLMHNTSIKNSGGCRGFQNY